MSPRSIKMLEGVNSALASIVQDAAAELEKNGLRLAVLSGLRTQTQQNKLVASGKSQNLDSKHLTGEAVDLCLLGQDMAKHESYHPIVAAIQKATKTHAAAIRWGGSWCCINDTEKDAKTLQNEYIARKKSMGEKPFLDSAHFELFSKSSV